MPSALTSVASSLPTEAACDHHHLTLGTDALRQVTNVADRQRVLQVRTDIVQHKERRSFDRVQGTQSPDELRGILDHPIWSAE
jgi:hypothetical protein